VATFPNSSLYSDAVIVYYRFSVAEIPLAEVYKFLGHLKLFSPFRMPGHHAASNAPLTYRLVIITKPIFTSTGSINCLASRASSVVLFCGINPNCLSFSNSFLCR